MKSSILSFWRGVLLFTMGSLFTILLSVLRLQQNTVIHRSKMLNHNCFHWWLPLICGSGSAFVGLIFPYLKSKGSDLIKCSDWSNVLRCFTMFVGLNEACTKVEFPSNLQLSITLAVLSVGLWWYFDGTPIGLVMGVGVAVAAITITQVLVLNQICIYSEQEFSYLKSWLPYVVFSGSITIANIGEQLAVKDYDGENKSHAE